MCFQSHSHIKITSLKLNVIIILLSMVVQLAPIFIGLITLKNRLHITDLSATIMCQVCWCICSTCCFTVYQELLNVLLSLVHMCSEKVQCILFNAHMCLHKCTARGLHFDASLFLCTVHTVVQCFVFHIHCIYSTHEKLEDIQDLSQQKAENRGMLLYVCKPSAYSIE